MKQALPILVILALAGCQGLQPPGKETLKRIDTELENAAQVAPKPAQPEAVANALIPPLRVELPSDAGKPLEPRFDLLVNNAPATQVFMSIVSGTRYSMLIHPEVTGGISVNLKDVTVLEALEAIRELYGYEYRVEGARIYVHPLTMQTRVFQVSYLAGTRKGRSELRVSASTAISGSAATPSAGTPADPNASQTGQSLVESAEVKTTVAMDFWEELAKSVALIVGNGGGRSVVVSPHT
ncbi:MAG TPA: secretin N-terminal domain-containing protein, partial [Burkholderiales bacterium]